MTHKLVSNWTDWRSCIGTPGSAQRLAADAYLRKRVAILYYGDSWFCAPFRATLARHSMIAIDGIGLVDGSPMATAERLFERRSLLMLQQRLLDNPFDLLAVSAGANDLLGARLQRLFAAWHQPTAPAQLSAEQAMEVIAEAQVLERLYKRYCDLLDAVRAVHLQRPAFRVVIHSYAPLQKLGAVEEGNGIDRALPPQPTGEDSSWLFEPMGAVLGCRAELRRFAQLLLGDGLYLRVIKPVLKGYSRFVRCADLREVPELATAAGWSDEFNPSAFAFAAAVTAFNATLRSALPTAKRKAVGAKTMAGC